MDIPVITLNGEEVQATKPKAIAWRKLMEFDQNKAEVPAAEYITKHCEALAYIYPVDAERIEEEADLDEIYFAYHNALVYITGLLTAKLGSDNDEKNGEAAK